METQGVSGDEQEMDAGRAEAMVIDYTHFTEEEAGAQRC